MARKCGLVIYNRPCRENKPRYYTVCDVARIAERAVNQGGADKNVVIRTVAARLGYEVILNGQGLDQKTIQNKALLILKAAGTIEDLTSEIPVISKLGFLIKFIVQFAGTVSFVVAYVAAKIIAGNEIGFIQSCKR